MEVGDYIVVKGGRRKVLGIGVVTSDYFLDKQRAEYQHCRRVRWLTSRSVELPSALSFDAKTLTEITPYQDLISFIKDQYVEAHTKAPSPIRHFILNRSSA
jgi:5-methylcytosine-specific restriction enzyme B